MTDEEWNEMYCRYEKEPCKCAKLYTKNTSITLFEFGRN